MKKLNNIEEKYKVIKNLLTTKEGLWAQIEILEGPREGMRMPSLIEKKEGKIPKK